MPGRNPGSCEPDGPDRDTTWHNTKRLMQASGREGRSGGTNGGETELDVAGEAWERFASSSHERIDDRCSTKYEGIGGKAWDEYYDDGVYDREGQKQSQYAWSTCEEDAVRTQQRGPGTGMLDECPR